MLGAHNHIGGSEECIASGGVNGELVLFSCEGELNLCTGALSDPVLLLSGDTLNIINTVQTLDKLFGVLGDLQHPLALNLADYFASASFAHAVNNLLICEAYLTGGAPVNGHLGLVSESRIEKL